MAGRFGLIVEGPGKASKPVPLQTVAVSGRIKGYVFGLETKLSYRNNSDDPLEVVFRFPVDESSAVVGLEAKIDGRTIKGVVREKEEARQMYDDAVSSGLTAALGEEKTGDIFSLALGNLPPKGEAEIVLKLCGELGLDKESEAALFSLPAVLKPRYTPAGSSDPLAPIGGEGGQVEKGSAPAVSSFSIQVDRADGVSSIISPTHGINTSPKDNGAVEVTLSENGPLDKDVVILVQYKDPHTPRAMVEDGRPEKENELMSNPAVMLEFFPKFSSLQAACEFLFVIDRSGSMDGAYIKSARETLVLFLKSIPPGCYFNIIGFGSSYEHLFPSSVPYNQGNLDKAMKHAQGLRADLGGTELLRPLQYVFDQKPVAGLPRQVFVLTDGSVSNTDACIDLTKKNVHIARVFTFGIGSGASTALVKGLARAGNGSAEFIKEGERLQGKVISSLKKALQPSVTDVQLKFSVPAGVEVLQAPSKIPPVFNGEKLVLYGLLKGGAGKSGQGTAVLRGKILGSDVEHNIGFQLEGRSPSYDMPIIHQLAAKSLIQDWQSSGNDKSEKKAAIIKLSVESSVVSCHTSYIAVDEEQNKPIEGAIKTYDLTATSTPSYLLAGHRYGGGSLGFGGGAMNWCSSLRAGSATATSNGVFGSVVPHCASYSGGYSQPSPYLQASCSSFLGAGMPPPASGMVRGSHMTSYGAPPPPPPTGGFYSTPRQPPTFTQGRASNSPFAPNTRSMLSDTSSHSGYGGPGAPPPPPPTGGFYSTPRQPPQGQTSYGPFDASDDVAFDSPSSFRGVPIQSPLPDPALSRLIVLQTAEGSWSLNEGLASVVGRSLSDIRGSCPSGCSEVVWGTLLAIALLETKFSSQRDEWELISMKSEMWLQGQTIPAGETLASLRQTAKSFLSGS